MPETNRLRCPHCGMCYEGDTMATEVRALTCQNCGAATKLVEEDPDGVLSGAFPPLPRLLALTAAIALSLLAVRFSFSAILAFGVLVYLAVEVFQGHKKQRTDRIALWNSLRDAHTSLSARIATLSAELSQSKSSIDEATSQNNKIMPEFNLLRKLCTTLTDNNTKLSMELDQARNGLTTLSYRYEQIAPEQRDRLATEIFTQKQTLGIIGELTELTVEKNKIEGAIKELRSRVVLFEEEELLQSFGFYKPLYDCADSTAYSQLLDKIRDKQKEMVKERTALRTDAVFSIENDKAGGKKVTKNLEKLTLRAFNGECDATIDKVTFSNLDAIAARITKAYQDLNNICQSIGISISQAYLNAKIEELHVCYEYKMKLKDEREEQRKIREQMREQAKLMKEIEDAREKIEKEETHFNQIISELKTRMELAAASEREQYETKLREYEDQLAVVKQDKVEVAYREQSTRAGYVYVISNLGSFGEHTYKIGVTRRLEPLERVDELGDASVPFDFDVHAMIFSDDAPTLEGALHEHFADRAINKINPRKEFFRVKLEEIEEVVRTHHNKVVEFTRIAKAEDYRLSMAKEYPRPHEGFIPSGVN